MGDWIPVVGTLTGALLGAAGTWWTERWRHATKRTDDARLEKARAYSIFLSALYQFMTTGQQISDISRVTNVLTGPRNLRYLERSGLAASSTNSKDQFMIGYSLVLIWGSAEAKATAEELLALVREFLDPNSHTGDEQSALIAKKRSEFLTAIHVDLGLPATEQIEG
jgi:hypothetical protein